MQRNGWFTQARNGVIAAAVGGLALATPTSAADDSPTLASIPSFSKAADILGIGGPKESLAKAVPMLEAVARRGDARAQVMLGAVLLQGELVPQDKVAGYAWLQIGKESGDGPFDATTRKKADELMRKVEPGMSGSDLIKADQITQRFLAERARRIDEGIAQAAMFYVGERPTEPELQSFANDPVTVRPGLVPASGDSFMLGCASDGELSGCDGGGEPAPADSCSGTIPRSQSKPIDLRDPDVRLRRPKYPAAARRVGHEGDTRLVMHVDRSGWICSLRVGVSSGIEILDQAALQGARRWRLNPATRNGVPVESLQVAVVSFALTGYEFDE